MKKKEGSGYDPFPVSLRQPPTLCGYCRPCSPGNNFLGLDAAMKVSNPCMVLTSFLHWIRTGAIKHLEQNHSKCS